MKNILMLLLTFTFVSCGLADERADAYGNFEATEVMVSSQANGVIVRLDIQEGDQLEIGEEVGVIDTLQLTINRKELKASLQAISAQMPDISSQLDVIDEQMQKVLLDKRRIEALFLSEAATQKQMDDVSAQLELLKRERASLLSGLNIQTRSLIAQRAPLEAKIELVNDHIARSRIVSPISGVVLNKYVERGELAAYGSPIFLIANLEELILKVYVSETQLTSIKLGARARVRVDSEGGNLIERDGVIRWVSPKAEFTPKIVQTNEERVNLVYAVKISVTNDGSLKIGMPGEVIF
ncbi:MAG: HlyD family secretion protein [Bacteroidales bacterium]